jgi:hypothetical protein
MTLEYMSAVDRCPLSLGERVRVRDRLVRPAPVDTAIA